MSASADRVERIEEGDAETPRPRRRLAGHFADHAVDADRRDGRQERVRRDRRRRRRSIADSAQPSAVTFAISGEPLAISTARSPSVTKSTAPVAATTQFWRRASAIADSAGRGGLVSAVDALGRGGLVVQAGDVGGGQDLGSVAAHDRWILGEQRGESSRCDSAVAPTPTGSSTQGRPRRAATSADASMPTTQSVDRVPMLTTSASAIAPKSSASSGAWTIAGEAPIASSALAATSIDT